MACSSRFSFVAVCLLPPLVHALTNRCRFQILNDRLHDTAVRRPLWKLISRMMATAWTAIFHPIFRRAIFSSMFRNHLCCWSLSLGLRLGDGELAIKWGRWLIFAITVVHMRNLKCSVLVRIHHSHANATLVSSTICLQPKLIRRRASLLSTAILLLNNDGEDDHPIDG